MSITDELREWMYGHTTNCSDNRIALVAIADRIDEAHKHAIAYVDDRDPVTMAEHGWIRVLDMEDVPIRVGDKMETDDGTVFVVEEIALYTWGVRLGGNGVDGNGVSCRAYPLANNCRHYHEPTVEDVLEEFAQMYIACNDKGTIAEYAKKLRLAGEDE